MLIYSHKGRYTRVVKTKADEIRLRVLHGDPQGNWQGIALPEGYTGEIEEKMPKCPHTELLFECAQVLGISFYDFLKNSFYCGSYHYTIHPGRDPIFDHPEHPVDVTPRHNFCLTLYRALKEIVRYQESHPDCQYALKTELGLGIRLDALTITDPDKMNEEIDQAQLFIAMSSFKSDAVLEAIRRLTEVFKWEDKDFSIEGMVFGRHIRKLRAACQLIYE